MNAHSAETQKKFVMRCKYTVNIAN